MHKYAKTTVLGLMAFGLSLIVAAPAAAQNRPELGIAYQFSTFTDFDFNYTRGFGVDIAIPLPIPALAVVGEVGMGRFTEEAFTSNLLTVGGGVRWTPAIGASIEPYVQGTIGVVRFSESFDGFDFSDSGMMFDVGGGVNYPLNDTWDLFGQFGFRRVFDDGASGNGTRLLIGARVGL